MTEVLNQGQKKTCANYALMAILLKKGFKFDLERLSTIKVPYIQRLEELFKKEGLIKEFKDLKTFRLVDYWLKQGEWLLTATFKGDFTIEDNVGRLVEFDEKTQHFFVITENCGDKWKCLNSWGEEWGDDGFFYIKKSDFKFLITPKRVITK